MEELFVKNNSRLLKITFSQDKNLANKAISMCISHDPGFISENAINHVISFLVDPLVKQERIIANKSFQIFLNAGSKEALSMYNESLVDALISREFDVNSICFEIFGKSDSGRKQSSRRIIQKPGWLRVTYSPDEDGILDLICAWSSPCTKRECNLMFHYLNPIWADVGFIEQLKSKASELDPRTILFKCKKI